MPRTDFAKPKLPRKFLANPSAMDHYQVVTAWMSDWLLTGKQSTP